MRVFLSFALAVIILSGLAYEHFSCKSQSEQVKSYLDSYQYKADIAEHMKRMEGLK